MSVNLKRIALKDEEMPSKDAAGNPGDCVKAVLSHALAEVRHSLKTK